MRGFPFASESDLPFAQAGECLVAEPDDGPTRPLYAQISEDLMAFLEAEQRRRRLPGRPDVPKGTIVSFGLEAYRELVAIADELNSEAPIEKQVEALINLLHRSRIPILAAKRGHSK
ncbi:MAG: hypothetical protein ACM3XM_01575 [Mycobacterium leprae]